MVSDILKKILLKHYARVLILVLMEYGLGLDGFVAHEDPDEGVLILVLMEYGLGRIIDDFKKRRQLSS